MSFWVPLVYHGARVAGLQEMSTVLRHRAALIGPADLADTSAGEIFSKFSLQFMVLWSLFNQAKLIFQASCTPEHAERN